MTTAKLVIIVKILLTIILIGTICAITLIIYLFKGDVKAKVPGYVKKEYNLNKLVIIVKILLTIILIGTICAITLIIYLFKGDVKAKVPGYVKKEYNLNKYEVENRPIYVMNSKKGITNELVIMYIHGGSYVGDLEKEHWKTCGDIVNKLGCTIILPDYPLTPKYNYKDTFNMMEALYKKVINKVDSAKFVVMGDSAGGGVALALMQKMGEENIKMPNQTILISPWLDVRMNNPEIEKISKNDPMLNKSALKLAGENYAGKDGINSYLVNPIEGPLDKIKNVSIFTGTYDILNPDVKYSWWVLCWRFRKRTLENLW